jgi:outer membrane protein assembly factor BamB
MQWEGVHGAILTDVNGDGVPDVVGRLRYATSGDHVTLGAFEGATGKRLWESVPVGSYSDTSSASMGLAEDTLVLCEAGGGTSGWSVRDGVKRWTGTLPEKAKHLCKGDHPGEVRVVLADDTVVAIRLADGHASAPAPLPRGGNTCVRIPTDKERDGDPGVDMQEVMGAGPTVDGMRGSVTFQRAGGPKIVLGSRAKGTAVPMIAAVFADPSHDWKSDLPAARPLEAISEPWPSAALTGTRVFTDYRLSSGTTQQLVAFDLTGHRLWETPTPDSMPLSSLGADDHRLFVSQWTHLTVLDAATGRTLYTIGRK